MNWKLEKTSVKPSLEISEAGGTTVTDGIFFRKTTLSRSQSPGSPASFSVSVTPIKFARDVDCEHGAVTVADGGG